MPINLQKLGVADVALAQQLFLFFQKDDGIVDTLTKASDEYIQRLLAKDDFHVLIATKQDTIIGGLTAYEMTMYLAEVREMFLYEIGVEPGYRQQGVGRALIEFLKTIASARGIRAMYVGTETDNGPALKLYAATGGIADAKIAWFNYEID